jgi:hypothetical protein
VSNRRKIKPASGRPLPRCADCHATTYTGTTTRGAAVLRVEHDPSCPAWHGITPNSVEAYAQAEAATGRTVVYCRDLTLPKE